MQARVRLPSTSVLCAAFLAGAGLPAQAPPAGKVPGLPKGEVVRGITISTHGIGLEWADPAVMRPTLRRIKDLGAAWVAFHPYAGIREDGSVRWKRTGYGHRYGRGRRIDSSTYWKEPVRLAHEAGLKVLVKPHLAYWGTRFRWRGEISFETREEWSRFFRDYRAWILEMAEACKEADGFIVGTELDRTVRFEEEWRGIIAQVRKRTKAALSYAANWTDYDRVPFWDALDVIGIQAYFPLTEEEDPKADTLAEAWKERMEGLRRFALSKRRNIVFTELGYNRSFDAARRPWEHRTDGPEASALQARCLDAALRAIGEEPCVLGAFLWKWFPGPRPNGRNFQLATGDLRALIARHWKGSGGRRGPRERRTPGKDPGPPDTRK